MSTITSQFSPLKPPVPPVSMEGVEQVFVELPTSYDETLVVLDIASVDEWLETCNTQESQVSHLSVQLKSNQIK